MLDRQRKGADAEAYAKEYLISQGLTWVMSNYRSCFGEIDLIMRESSVVVFVEVRARSSHLYPSDLKMRTMQVLSVENYH